MANPIKVFLADDHALVREGLRQILEFDGSIEVIAEASNGLECLTLLEYFYPDVLLLDINMPVMNGLDVLSRLHERESSPKVILLTVHNEVEYLLRAIEIGANGYVLKDADSSELKNAINLVYSGESYIDASLLPELDKHFDVRVSDKDKIQSLTRREFEVLLQIANGLLNKEIANNLDISERTVKNHISNIFKKIDVNDRTQAAVFAIKNDLIKLY